jgi:hypothetical protein
MTIPYVGRCLGSGEPARAGSIERTGKEQTGVCVACSGRFDLQDGRVVEHETAEAGERESMGDRQPPHRA